MDAADGWARDQPGEHLLERAARPHGALAVVAVIEKLRLRWPGEHHRLAAEANAVRQTRGIERRRLERLVEAVDVEQHVARAGRRIEQLAGTRHGRDLFEPPVIEPDRREREAAVVRRRKLGARERA